jgi:hypothetical protein
MVAALSRPRPFSGRSKSGAPDGQADLQWRSRQRVFIKGVPQPAFFLLVSIH